MSSQGDFVEWQFSSERMTVLVVECEGVVTDAAPIVRRFIGQSVDRLESWMRRQGGFCKFLVARGDDARGE